MTDAVRIPLAIAGELLLYLMIGGLVPLHKRPEKYSLCETACAGYLIYTATFEAAVFVVLLINCPLRIFARIWVTAVSVLLALSLVFFSGRQLTGMDYGMRVNGVSPAAVVFAFCAGAYGIFAMILPVGSDPSWTIASMTQDLFHDSVGRFAAGTGEVLTAVPAGEFLAKGYVHDEIVCLITGLHPLTEMRVVRTAVTLLLSVMILYRCFFRLFDENRTKAAGAGILYLVISVLFQTSLSPSGLLLSAGWTGNAAFCNIILPSLLLLAMILLEDRGRIRPYILLAALGIAAVSMSQQAIFLTPVAMTACLLTIFLMRRDLFGIFKLILLLAVPAAALLMCLILPVVAIG